LKFCLSIEILFDGILSTDESLHGFLEAVADVVEDLGDGSWGELGESSEGEEADDWFGGMEEKRRVGGEWR